MIKSYRASCFGTVEQDRSVTQISCITGAIPPLCSFALVLQSDLAVGDAYVYYRILWCIILLIQRSLIKVCRMKPKISV